MNPIGFCAEHKKRFSGESLGIDPRHIECFPLHSQDDTDLMFFSQKIPNAKELRCSYMHWHVPFIEVSSEIYKWSGSGQSR